MRKITTNKLMLYSATILAFLIVAPNTASAISVDDPIEKIMKEIGSVEKETYNENLAFQIAMDISAKYDEVKQKKHDLEKRLTEKNKEYQRLVDNGNISEAENVFSEIIAIKNKIDTVEDEIAELEKKYDRIEDENGELYHIEEQKYLQMLNTKNEFWEYVDNKYWKGNSLEQKMDSFPLAAAGINGKQKAIHIVLHESIKNTEDEDQYRKIISDVLPDNTPYFITFGKYPIPECAQTRCDEFDPLIGGIEIQAQDNGLCTLGFEADRDDEHGFVTAGHCGDDSVNQDVFQPSTFNGGRDVGFVEISLWFDGSHCDCSFVPVDAGINIDNAIYQSDTSTYTPQTTTPSSDQLGDFVKKSGRTTGNAAGTVLETGYTATYNDTGTLIDIHSLVKADYSSDGGDSGAPVTNNLGSSLYGVHSGEDPDGNGLYSPIDEVMGRLDATPVLG